MKRKDYIAAWLCERLNGRTAQRILCALGFHYWAYLGEIGCWPAGKRHLWSCTSCPAEKWLRTEFE